MAKKEIKEYSWEEISKHNTESSCWIVVYNKVFDVTPFLDKHPGGGKIIVKTAGKDATEAYERAFHSPKARGMLKGYLIGKLSSKNHTGLTVMQGLGQGSRRTGYPSLQ